MCYGILITYAFDPLAPASIGCSAESTEGIYVAIQVEKGSVATLYKAETTLGGEARSCEAPATVSSFANCTIRKLNSGTEYQVAAKACTSPDTCSSAVHATCWTLPTRRSHN